MVKKRILVIDDEVDLSELITLLLKKEPFEVFYVSNLLEAKIQINSIISDIVILDYILPDGSGLEFFRNNKLLLSESMVIFMTADSSPKLHAEALESGIDFYLPKPFDVWSLREIIMKIPINTY